MLEISKKMAIIITVILLFTTISSIASAQQYNDFDFEDIAPGLGAACCGIVAVMWIIWLLIAIWVYKDAEKRRKSGIVWFLVVFILGIIGIIIWFLVRPPITEAPGQHVAQPGAPAQARTADSDRRCPNCGRIIPMDARACPYCAKKFEEH